MSPRKKVIWTPAPASEVELNDGAFPAAPATILADYVAELKPGDLLQVLRDLEVYDTYNNVRQPPPCLFLTSAHFKTPEVQKGAVAMYLGTIRTTEKTYGTSMSNRVLRHMIGVGGKRFFIIDFRLLGPL